MVMETPSPQCVGHEFVRQYYTVLNKAPMYLHRFYSHNSLFMHGGPNSVSDPIVGQTEIHKKILSLNFQDCHAKIRMVDAHATLGSGVVVQVIGELSNSGNPMRRFMQTFVLAPQSPKKFYVHNDIFRYQDEVFNDDESTDEGITCDQEEEIEAPSSTTGESNFQHSSTMNGSAHLQLEEQTHLDTHSTPPAESHISTPAQVKITPSPPVVPVVPATIAAEPRPSTPPMPEADGWSTTAPATDPYDSLDESSSVMTPTKESTPSHVEASPLQTTEPASPSPRPAVARTPSSPVVPSHPQPAPVKISQQPPEPKTYANLFKGNTYSAQVQPQLQPPQSVTRHQPAPQPASDHNTSPVSAQQPRVAPTRSSASLPSGPPPSNSFQGGNSFRNVPSRGMGGFSSDDEKRRPMPDSHQVFVGNLPHNVGEDELRAEFSKFGPVSDVRINLSKGKGPGHSVPNFGFVTFEEEEDVRSCLAQRPIHLNGDHRLNVEEKKARSRGMDGGMGRPTSGRGGSNMGMSRGGNSMMMGRGGRGGGFGGSREGGRGMSSGGPRGGGGFMPRR